MNSTATLTQPLKWHGGKGYLASRIIGLMPPRCKNPNKPADDDAGYLHYCEPYAGGLAVLLENDPAGISEVVNDINGELTNFWRVLQDRDEFERFQLAVQTTPFSEKEWQAAATFKSTSAWPSAWKFFIRCRQSLAGRMDSFAPLSRMRTRRGMNEQVSAWLNTIEGLPAVHARLKRVVILNRDALDVIREQDGPRTLYYLDPPYLKSTRTAPEVYDHEMIADDHKALLDLLATIKGRFLLSGYRSDLYDEFAQECKWRRVDFEIPNHAAGGKTKRKMTECVWMNY